MKRLVLFSLAAISVACAFPLRAETIAPNGVEPPASQPQRGSPTAPRDFFPPWEGSGVYAFGPLLIDLNRRRERWVPGRTSPLVDCSNTQLFCLTARGAGGDGVIAFAGPRTCSDFRVGDNWGAGNVRTRVLALRQPSREPIRDSADYHRPRSAVIYYLGDESNPQIVYEYTIGGGVVAIHHGLVRHPDLVREVREGLDPYRLPPQHRLALSTFDRFAPCRAT